MTKNEMDILDKEIEENEAVSPLKQLFYNILTKRDLKSLWDWGCHVDMASLLYILYARTKNGYKKKKCNAG